MGCWIFISFLCTIVLQAVYGQYYECPTGWIQNGLKCYFFAHNHQRNWLDAQYACHSMRAQMLSIEDFKELKWLQEQFQQIKTKSGGTLEWWTSLQKKEADGHTWFWESGGQLNSSFVRWGQGEPNNYQNNEHCAEICCPHYLNDINCDKKINYICEFDIESTPLTCEADDGWEYHNGSCYKFVPKFKTWNDSISDCENMDSSLAAVTDSSTFSAVSVMSSYRQADTWIGVYRSNKAYYLINNTETTAVDDHVKPTRNRDGGACMSANSSVKFPLRSIYPDACNNTKQFICQKPEGVCGEGMFHHQSRCYYFSALPQKHLFAELFCASKKMILVEINSVSESRYLISILHSRKVDQVWIGLQRNISDSSDVDINSWFWKSSKQTPKLDHWWNRPWEVNETQNNCAYMDYGYDGLWSSKACDQKLNYVCESPALTTLRTIEPSTTVPTTTTERQTTVLTTTPTTTIGTTLATCEVEHCEALYAQANDVVKKGFSSQMDSLASAYYESTKCIALRTMYRCIAEQPRHCYDHYDLQLMNYRKLMIQNGCSKNPNAAVFDPDTMVPDCRMDVLGVDYRGFISKTKSQRTCQAWSSQYPHKQKFGQDLYDQKNYCRNPDKEEGGPWCYTTDIDQRWEYCDVPYCNGATTSATTPTTTTAPTTTTEFKTWSEKCGMFWEDSTIEDVCFHFSKQLVDWMTARTRCDNLGGSLVSITTLPEQYYLSGAIRNSDISPYWIGANSRGSEEGWRWSDGAPFSFLHWMPDQPDGVDEDEDCAAIDTVVGQWEDRQCSEKLGYICHKSVAGSKPPTPPPTSPRIGEGQMYGCPEGWLGYQSDCYLIARNKTTWSGARSQCRKQGADLVSITGEGEQDFLTSQIPSKMCFNVHSSDEQCDKWAKSGECSKNPVWMSQHCHLGCNLCIKDCTNLHTSVECDYWAKIGECGKNPSYMLKNCALSCGVCDGGIYGGFWIGLSDYNHQMSFEWSDDSKVSYTKWAKNEPNNWNGQTQEDCVMMLLKNGYWNDANCNMVQPGFICKKRKQVIDKVTVSPLSVGCVNDSIGYDAYCYGINDEANDWETAENICSQVQYGHLATINDRYIHLFLASQLVGKSGDFWIGLKQDLSTGAMESWSSGLPVQYTAWSRHHTGSIDEDGMCVSMGTSHPIGSWDTKNCSSKFSFICEYPREGVTTSTTTTTTVLPPTCPSYWVEFENYCYKKFSLDGGLSWLKSRDYCRDRGADLASIHSYEEGNYLLTQLFGYRYAYPDTWIGLNDRDSENGWQWSDSSPFDFASWAPHEPNDYYSSEDCVAVSNRHFQWNDDNCYKKKNFICKIMKGMPLIEPNITSTKEFCDTDEQWVYFNGFCYYKERYGGPKTFKDAEKMCNGKKAHLLSIHSQAESDWLMENVYGGFNDAWIGLNRLSKVTEGYSWTDAKPVQFINWAKNGRDTNHRCVAVKASTGRWVSKNCFEKTTTIICKKSNTTEHKGPWTPTHKEKEGGCLPGFTRSTFNSKCYKVFTDVKYWSKAKTSCAAFGKSFSLVAIESQLEQWFITSLMTNLKNKLWIGLTDAASYRTFYWEDGTDLKFTNWHEQEPNGYNEHCGDIFVEREKFGQWNDESCFREMNYMCQGLQDPNLPMDTDINEGCLPGYTKYQYSDTDFSCFKFFETAKTWNASRDTCLQDNGDLVSIRNTPEESFIMYLTFNLTTSSIWTGLTTQMSQDGITYKWSSNWPLLYAVFDPDNLPSKPCIAVQGGSSYWTGQDCDTEFPFVCETDTAKPPETADDSSCKENGYLHNGRCFYIFLHNPLTWPQARSECQKLGYSLTSLKNGEEIAFLLNLLNKLSGMKPKTWIGLNKLDTYRPGWSWVDGSNYVFQNWNLGEPSTTWHDQSEQCVEMRPDGTWNDLNCYSYSRPYICSGDKVMATTIPTTMETTMETTNQTQAFVTTEATTVSSKAVNPDKEEFKANTKVSEPATNLTVGQIIGVLIGVMACIVILSAILFIIRFNKQNGNYKASSFVNALYMKNTEEVSVDENNSAMGSTVKICGSDAL